MATLTNRNGVDVDRLVATVGAVKADPNVAKFTFRACSSWQSGGRNKGEIREFEHAGATTTERPQAFELIGDEPPVLLGTNAGPNAVELVLQALAFCYAVGYAYNAAAKGIEIEELRYEVEGDLDLHRFLGLGGSTRGAVPVRPGHVTGPRYSRRSRAGDHKPRRTRLTPGTRAPLVPPGPWALRALFPAVFRTLQPKAPDTW